MVALCMTVAIAPGRLSGLALECDVDTGERFSMTVGDGALRVRSAPKRVITEGDLVAVNSHYTTAPNTRGRTVIDPFRMRDQKIVEHWLSAQDVPATSANDNTMF